jgi:hypothetical protein
MLKARPDYSRTTRRRPLPEVVGNRTGNCLQVREVAWVCQSADWDVLDQPLQAAKLTLQHLLVRHVEAECVSHELCESLARWRGVDFDSCI